MFSHSDINRHMFIMRKCEADAVWGWLDTSQHQHASIASACVHHAWAPSVEIGHHLLGTDPFECHRATINQVFPGLADLGSMLGISIFSLGLLIPFPPFHSPLFWFPILQRWAATKAQTDLQRLLISWRP